MSGFRAPFAPSQTMQMAAQALMQRLRGRQPISAPAPFTGAPIPGAPAWTQSPATPGFGPPGMAPAPPPAEQPAPQEDAVTVTARRVQPYDGDVPWRPPELYQRPKMDWGERLQLLGATMQQMGSPQGQIAATDSALDARHRQKFGEDQAAKAAAAQEESIRRYLGSADVRDDPDHPAYRMLKLARSPQEFIDAMLSWDSGAYERARQGRQEALQARAVESEIGSRERDLQIQEQGQRYDYDLGRRRAALDGRRAALDERRFAYEMEIGGKDPMEREMIKRDVARADEYQAAADAAMQILPDLQAFAEANSRESGTGPGRVGAWLPLARNDATKEMIAITNRLTPALRAVGSGTMSDNDARMFQESLPSIGNSRATNKRIIATYKAVAQRAADRARLARDYLHSKRSLRKFNEAWSEYILDAKLADGDYRSFDQWYEDNLPGADK